VIAIAAMVGVLLTTVLAGMVLAVLLSVMFVLYRASRPYVATLGRMPGYRATYADMARHPEAEPIPALIIVRLDAPLYFFNANVAKAQILELVASRQSAPHGMLIDLAATADLDVTTADMLRELHADLRARDVEVLLAQVKGPVRDRMRRTGLMAEMGEDRVYLSIGSAVTDFGRRWPPEAQAPAEGERPPEASSEPEHGAEPDSAPGRAPGP